MQNSIITTILLVFLAASPIASQDKVEVKQAKSVTELTSKLQKIDGYIPLYWNVEEGKLLMEISRWNSEMLYQISLPTGVGSNPIGLDRGQLGDTHVIFFERVGPKVLMIEPNYRYRATSDNVAERRAVEESFARSVLWGFKVEAAEGERAIVDATGFSFCAMRTRSAIAWRGESGSVRARESRSAFHLPKTKLSEEHRD